MHRVPRFVLQSLVVWFAVLSTVALADDYVGFEPRDSWFVEREPRSRRIEVHFDDHGKPVEPFEVPPDPDFTKLCAMCPDCLICVRKHYSGALPWMMLDKKDFLIFHSIEGKDIEKAVKGVGKDLISKLLRNVGMNPLRLWVSVCTIIVSLFPGVFRVCNCDPPPSPYQILLMDTHNFFSTINTESCKNRQTQCVVQIQSGRGSYFLHGGKFDGSHFIQPKDTSDVDRIRLDFPKEFKIELKLVFEYLEHVEYEETFFAVSRTQLLKAADDVLAEVGKTTKVFSDLGPMISDKITGQWKYCYEIGKLEQNVHSFTDFIHHLDKTK